MARLAPPAPSAAAAATVAAAAASAASTLARTAPAATPRALPPLPPRGRALLWATIPALAALLGFLWLRRRRRPRSLPPPSQPSPEAAAVASEAVPVSLEAPEVVSAASEEIQAPITTIEDSSDGFPRSRRRLSGSACVIATAVTKASDDLIAPTAPILNEKLSLASSASADSDTHVTFSEAAGSSQREDSPLRGGRLAQASTPERLQNGHAPLVGEAAPQSPRTVFTLATHLKEPREGEARSLNCSSAPCEESPQRIKTVPADTSAFATPTNDGVPISPLPLAANDTLIVGEASVLTKEPSIVISEASAVTSKAPPIISEASALTVQASKLMKEVPESNGPTPAIISKAPALINEASALIKEAEAIQKAVPTLTNDASVFKVEAPEIISKAPALISEASALLKEAQALINQVPGCQQPSVENTKPNLAKNGDSVPNFLEEYIALGSKVPQEQKVQEEISSTNSTLAGVEDFDTFELATEGEDITKGTDLKVPSRRESEIPVTFELVDDVYPKNDHKAIVRSSEVCPKKDSTNEPLKLNLRGDDKLKVGTVEQTLPEVNNDSKSDSRAKAVESECNGEVKTKVANVGFEGEKSFFSAEGTLGEEVAQKGHKSSKHVSSVLKEVDEVVVKKTQLVQHSIPTKSSAQTAEEIPSKAEATPERVEQVVVSNEKLVASPDPTKSSKKKKKKGKSKQVEKSPKTTKVAEEVASKSKANEATSTQTVASKKAPAKAAELVFTSQATVDLEVSPLVGAGEGTTVASKVELTNTRHPRTDGEEPEAVAEVPTKQQTQSQQQPQGEVPAHELARLLGQLRGDTRCPQTGGGEMPPAPGDGPAGGPPAAATATAAGPAPATRSEAADEEATRARKGHGGAAVGQRDSANHSPAEGMLASPRAHDACSSLSGDEGDEEEGDSSDSGKGCSDAPTPPPSRTPASGSSVSGDPPLATGPTAPDVAAAAAAAVAAAAAAAAACGEHDPAAAADAAASVAAAAATGARVYEFVLPQHLVGRLIGRHGCFVHQIKARTNASILIKRHPDTARLKVCAVEGSPADVEGALEMIRQKFPEKRYPNVSLEQVCFVSPALPVVPVLPDCLRLQLVEGISNDVILSSLVSPAHFFLQQPTHPTFPALARLCACMDATYGGDVDTPAVPTVQAGIVVAAPVMGSWFRAEVVAAEPDADTCQVRYVDYGGYEVQQNSALRQIRSDFMTLPFQAAECYLANVVCNSEEEGWSTEALSAVDQLTAGQVLQAQVCGYCEDGVPAVSLYAVSGSQVVSVTQELVARGLAQWWEPTDG